MTVDVTRRAFSAGLLGSFALAAVGGKASAAAGSSAKTAALPPASLYQAEFPDQGEIIGELERIAVSREDTLLRVAREHSLGYVEIAAANPEVDPWLPEDGREILLPKRRILPAGPREGILVNLAEMRLYFFPEAEDESEGESGVVRSFPIGVGREALTTPIGQTTVVRKAKDPIWYPTEATRRDRPELPAAVPPGPDNPLGNRALYLGWPTYLIHGTNVPLSIGRHASRGCIRLYPEDAEALYEMVPVGMKVTTVEQAIKFAWRDGRLLMEAHMTKDQAEIFELEGRIVEGPESLARLIGDATGGRPARIDWEKAHRVLAERRGVPTQITS